MSESKSSAAVGTSPMFLLLLLFVALKLTGYIAWSWWLVLAPLWVPLAILAVVLLAWGLIVLLAAWARK